VIVSDNGDIGKPNTKVNRIGRAALLQTTTHEFCHLFNADHDGGGGGNTCPAQGFVMQAFQSARTEEILVFSTCSRERIANFRPNLGCIVE
jgi:hypothetical protein